MLTPKQSKFVDEYLIDLNATQAAIRAGYSAKTALVQGPRLLSNVRVSLAIEVKQSALATRTEVDQEWVVQHLVKNFNMAQMAGEGNVANRALELLGRYTGGFAERNENNQGAPVQVNFIIGKGYAPPDNVRASEVVDAEEWKVDE